jgi:hypothetical protein
MITAAYVLQAVACLACSLCFSAPFWLLYTKNWFQQNVADFSPSSQGLLAICYKGSSCTWLWESDFRWEKSLPDWYKAAQGLFAAGLLMLLIGWAIATFHVCCCRCCKESFSVGSALGSLTLSGLVLMTASLTLYGVYTSKDPYNASFKQDSRINYYWAFFVGIAGVAAALASVVLLFCAGCRNRSHAGYHMTRVV